MARGEFAVIGTGEVPCGDYPERSEFETAFTVDRMAIRDAGIYKNEIGDLLCTQYIVSNPDNDYNTEMAYAINSFVVPFPFWDNMPYVLAMIDLPEGPRMISNIVQCDRDGLENGMELEVVFDDVSENIRLPKWKPAQSRLSKPCADISWDEVKVSGYPGKGGRDGRLPIPLV